MKTTASKLLLVLVFMSGAAIKAQAQSWPSGWQRVPGDPCPSGYYRVETTQQGAQNTYSVNGGISGNYGVIHGDLNGGYSRQNSQPSYTFPGCAPMGPRSSFSPPPQTMPRFNYPSGPACYPSGYQRRR